MQIMLYMYVVVVVVVHLPTVTAQLRRETLRLMTYKTKKRSPSFSSGAMYSPLEFTSKRVCQYLTNCSKLSNLNRNALFASLLFC